jgi:hypothetical protein
VSGPSRPNPRVSAGTMRGREAHFDCRLDVLASTPISLASLRQLA